MKWLLSLLFFFSVLSPVCSQVQCIKGDCNNGYGTCVFSSGARYVGNFRGGKLHGQGILYFSNGDKYVGNWLEQFREGEGRLTFADGSEYFGQFSKNQFSGKGVMTYANGDRYDGNWRNDRPNGSGVFTYANGNRYEGYFKEGQYDGQGTLYFAAGGQFTGQWKLNRRDGIGTLRLPNGESIAGQWIDGQYRGDWTALAFTADTAFLRDCNRVPCGALGKFTYSDGRRYAGQFRNGRPEGIGAAFYPNGDRYEGQWSNDMPQGQGIMYYASGKSIGAYWVSGRPEYELFAEDRMVKGQTPATLASPTTDNEVKVWAVVVGAATYTHMPVLRFTDDDAYQLYAFLKSPEGGALPDDQVRLLIDEAATRTNILEAIRATFLRADENDVVLFYFSGHGLPGAFLPTDYDGREVVLPHETIKQLIAGSRAKYKLVIADACHSGSLLAMKSASVSNTISSFYQAFAESRGGTALFMSSKGEEYSLEDGGLRSGIFSHFLVRGLKGAADADSNRVITISEIFDYVFQKVRLYTGNVQTPTLTGSFDRNMPVAVVR